jgi:hypothetical protein
MQAVFKHVSEGVLDWGGGAAFVFLVVVGFLDAICLICFCVFVRCVILGCKWFFSF